MATGEPPASESEDVNYQIVSGYRVARWAFYWAVFAGVVSLLTFNLGVFVAALALAAPYLVLRQGRKTEADGEEQPAPDADDETDTENEYNFW